MGDLCKMHLLRVCGIHYNLRQFLRVLLISILLLPVKMLAIENTASVWAGFDMVGNIEADTQWKYYTDTQLELIDMRYKLDAWYASLGIGKQFTPKLLAFLTNRFIIGRDGETGAMQYEYRIWQEANFDLARNADYYLATRSILEERKLFGNTGIALRGRQRLLLRVPLKFWPTHTIMVTEEALLNFTTPHWVSNRFYSENRFYIGIGTRISELVNVDIGYMNQYFFNTTNQMNNILYINFNITGATRYFKG